MVKHYSNDSGTVYPKKYAHGFVVLCFVVVMQSFIMNSHEVFIHIHQGCFAGTGAIVRLPQCQWSKPDGYGKISQCITTTKHSKAVTVCIFLAICYSVSNFFIQNVILISNPQIKDKRTFLYVHRLLDVTRDYFTKIYTSRLLHIFYCGMWFFVYILDSFTNRKLNPMVLLIHILKSTLIHVTLVFKINHIRVFKWPST